MRTSNVPENVRYKRRIYLRSAYDKTKPVLFAKRCPFCLQRLRLALDNVAPRFSGREAGYGIKNPYLCLFVQKIGKFPQSIYKNCTFIEIWLKTKLCAIPFCGLFSITNPKSQMSKLIQ